VRLHVHRWGGGPPVVLVHGVVLGGRESWRAQRPLTQRWTLLAPDRPGHGRSPDARQDFDAEAPLVADQLLDEPVHLVGHSYGAIVAMLAAARRVENVKSLALIEPPATSVAAGDPAVDAWATDLRALFADPGDDLNVLLRRFFSLAGVPAAVPDALPEPLVRGARALVGARSPTEAQLPLAAIADAEVSCLVISGGHHEAYEAVCDRIALRTNADRAIIPGAGHLVPDTGRPFNTRLEAFWLRCS
jgi:pimeloyl-ACP methyl ester carboxylesterase